MSPSQASVHLSSEFEGEGHASDVLRIDRSIKIHFYCNGLKKKKRGLRGRKVEGVGVMKDKELKLEESGVSHTLGASGKVGRSCARERERQVSVL